MPEGGGWAEAVTVGRGWNCQAKVELHADTEEWVQASHAIRPIKWRHKMYGLPYGFCECGIAFAGDFNGIVALDLRTKAQKKKKRRNNLAARPVAAPG